MAQSKKKPKLDPKRAARFVWTEGQFTIEDGPNKKLVPKSKSQAKRFAAAED